MKTRSKKIISLRPQASWLLSVLFALAAMTNSARAASATWLAAPTDGNWETAGATPTSEVNWSTGTTNWPGGGGTASSTSIGDTATFNTNSSITTVIINNVDWNLKYLTFDTANCAAYTITNSEAAAAARWTGGGAITINSTVIQPQLITGSQDRLHAGGGLSLINNSTTVTAVLTHTPGIKANNSVNPNPTDQAVNLQGSNTGNNTFGGVITDYSNPSVGQYAAVTKSGTGTWYLTANNTYTGPTIITGGTLILSGSGAINHSTNVIVSGSGATLQFNNTMNLASVFTNGTAAPSCLFVTNSGTLQITNTIFQTPVTVSNLVVNSATLRLGVNGSTPFTNIVAEASLTAGTGIILAIDQVANLLNAGTFDLISYVGTDPAAGNFTVTVPSGYNAGPVTVDTGNKLVTVTITPSVTASSLAWVGATNSVLVNNWDTNTLNWRDATALTPKAYTDPDSVLFDDTASNSTVTLNTTVSPFGVVANNSTLNYTINGSGKISGPYGLTKQGNATLTLAESGGDNFSGSITNNGGTLILDDTNSAISGGLTVEGGATVQIGKNDANGNLPSGNVDDEGALIFSRSNNVIVSTAISGGGSLIQNGGGTLTLNNTNTYTGGTIVGKGTLALAGAGTISNSTTLVVSNAIFDVTGFPGTTKLLNDFNVTNASINVGPTNLQTPISVQTFEADGITSKSNIINVLALPTVASYPSTITLIKSANAISLTGGNFNFALGSLPVASPVYAGSLSESGDQTAILLTLTSGPTGIRPSVTWAGTNNVSATTNWSDRLNWQLPGAPSAADNVFFDGTTTAGDNLTINNVVDSNFTITSLTYDQTASGQWHNTLIPPNNVLTVTGAAGIGAGAAAGATTSVTISGSGEFDDNGAFNLNNAGGATDSHVTLDMSGLNTFKNIAPTATMSLGTAAQQIITFSLASTSIVNVATLNFEATAGNNGRAGTLNLGAATNTIDATNINISTGKGGVTVVQFGNNAPNGTVAIGGTGGGSARATMVLGNATSGSAVCNGQLLLAGHLASVLAGTLTLGGVGGSTGAGSAGTVTFDDGTFDVTSILMGSSTSAHSSSGTFTVGGDAGHTAILNVSSAGGGSLVLGNASITNGIGAGTLNINVNGTANVNCSITKNATLGAANTGTINLTDGTLNMVSGTIGTSALPIDTLNLSDNGTLDTKIQLNVNPSATNIVAAAVNVSGTTTINIASIGGIAGQTQIPIISYNNGSSPIGGLVLGTVPPGYIVGNGGALYDNTANQTIDLIVTPPTPLVWVGAVGSTLNSHWDTSTLDWKNSGSPSAYSDSYPAQFNDAASNSTVNLTTTLSPGSTTVSDNVLNYTFTGVGALGGSGSLSKQGSATLTLDNSGNNTYSSGTTIGGGTLQIGNNDTNGNLPPGNVTDNGTLAFNRSDDRTNSSIISGSGSLVKNDNNTLTLSGATSSYGGGTTITGGTVRPTGISALGTAGVTVNTGGTLVETAGDATNNAITLSNGTLGVSSGADFLLGTNSSLTISASTTNILQSSDPQSPATSRNIEVDGVLNGSGVAIVENATNITTPDGNQGVRFRNNNTVTPGNFSGTIIFTNNTKGELSVVGAGPFSPVNTGSFILWAGAYDGGNAVTCPAFGGYIEFNIRNGGGTTTIPNNFQIAGSGAVVINGLGTGNGAVATLGSLTIGGGQELIGYRSSGTTTNTVNFPTVTLTGGNATFTPHSPTFGATNQAGTDFSLGNIGQTSASGLIMAGLGNLTLAGTNTYTGNTTISNGTVFLSGNSALTNSPVITLAAGTLNASGRGDQTLTLVSGQTLFGNGTVTGNFAPGTGSTFSPGTSISAIGTLTVSGTAGLQGTTYMKINKSNTPATNDMLSANTIIYGGTLTVTNLGPALVSGDSFKFFSSGIIANSFSSTNLPPLSAGLAWTNSAAGTWSVTGSSVVKLPPHIVSFRLSGTNLVFSGTNGLVGGQYKLLTSTNVALPLANWTPVVTNNFDGGGNFIFTNGIAPNSPRQFYILSQ